MAGECLSSLPLPAWFPAALAWGIAFVSTIIVFIVYYIQERQLRKTFYGITDEMSEEEKQEEEAAVLGQFEEVKVIQSMEKVGPHSIAPTPGSQVKVMMKRRKPVGSTKPPVNSREQLFSTSVLASNQTISPKMEADFKFAILVDQNNFAIEIIEHLKTLIIEEVYRARTSHPQQKQLLSQDETRIGEFVVSEMRAKLEGLTNNNPWICHGRLMNTTNWVVNGHENLLGTPADLIMSVKVAIEQPISIVLIGYCLKHRSSASILKPLVPINPSKDKLYRSMPLDSTPHPTDPMTPSKHSKASQSSALKKMKTAEPINYPARTPVTKMVTTVVPQSATTTTVGSGGEILSPGHPGTTAIPRRSEAKKPIAPQTPKPPPTPKRTPPKQTIPTPNPAAPIQTSTPAPAPLAIQRTTTPKAHTPVLTTTKTITGISQTRAPANATTTTTHGIVTPLTQAPKTSSAPKLLHKKKTRSDDTQLSGDQQHGK